MPPPKGHPRWGGRQKGSPVVKRRKIPDPPKSRSADVASEFVDLLENKLRQNKGLELLDIGVELLTCGHAPTIGRIWLRLHEYRYGIPAQEFVSTIEHRIPEAQLEEARKLAREMKPIRQLEANCLQSINEPLKESNLDVVAPTIECEVIESTPDISNHNIVDSIGNDAQPESDRQSSGNPMAIDYQSSPEEPKPGE
jgi:hypothetical protein